MLPDGRAAFTAAELADVLGLHPVTIRRTFPAVRIGRAVRYLREDVLDHLSTSRRQPIERATRSTQPIRHTNPTRPTPSVSDWRKRWTSRLT